MSIICKEKDFSNKISTKEKFKLQMMLCNTCSAHSTDFNTNMLLENIQFFSIQYS